MRGPGLVGNCRLLTLIRVGRKRCGGTEGALEGTTQVSGAGAAALHFLERVSRRAKMSAHLRHRGGEGEGTISDDRGSVTVRVPRCGRGKEVPLFFALITKFYTKLLTFCLLTIPTVHRKVCERTGRRVVGCDSTISDRKTRLAGTRDRTRRSKSAIRTTSGRVRRRGGGDDDCRTLVRTCSTLRRRGASRTTLGVRGICTSLLPTSLGKVCGAVYGAANAAKVRKAASTGIASKANDRSNASDNSDTRKSTSSSSTRSKDCSSNSCSDKRCSSNSCSGSSNSSTSSKDCSANSCSSSKC